MNEYTQVAESIRYIMKQDVPKKLMIQDIEEYLQQLTGEVVIEGSHE